MARRRMIDPHFWRSLSVSRLNYFERVMLIGMISNADDYGKGYADAAAVRSDIFYFEDIPSRKIETALKHIRDNISVTFYVIDKIRYYRFDNWTRFQKLDHPTPSQIPEPTDESTNECFANDSRKKREPNENSSRKDRELIANEPSRVEGRSKNKEIPTTPPYIPPPADSGSETAKLYDADFGSIMYHYESCMGFPAPLAQEGIRDYLKNGVEPKVILEAINEACASSAGRPNWNYLRGIIERWIVDGLTTIEKVEADRLRRKEQKTSRTEMKPNNGWKYTVGDDGKKRDTLGNVIY